MTVSSLRANASVLSADGLSARAGAPLGAPLARGLRPGAVPGGSAQELRTAATNEDPANMEPSASGETDLWISHKHM